MIGRLVEALRWPKSGVRRAKDPIGQYIDGGRVPWSPGYSKFKKQLLQQVLGDAALMRRFAANEPLPPGFGEAIDERIVEIPWVLSRLRPGAGRVLDAGSVLNVPFLLAHAALASRRLYIFSLELDHLQLGPRLSYVHGDFREGIFRDGLFESITCISTLEHVGMWPIPKPPYAESLARPQPEKDLFAYREVLREFFRLLAPGGQLLLTVPVGCKEDQDWQQIFSPPEVSAIHAAFGGQLAGAYFYLHGTTGWNVASAEQCADAKYYNFVKTPRLDPDRAAAARAVACLELIRPA
jgi:hypothetical protein